MTLVAMTMPKLGESVEEGTISKWLVRPGDRIEELAPMLEVDTDKVSTEIPAPTSGIVKQLMAREGDTVKAGAQIALIESSTATPTSLLAVQAQPTSTANSGTDTRLTPTPAGDSHGNEPTTIGRPNISPAVRRLTSELNVDPSLVTGTGGGGRVTAKDVAGFAAARSIAAAPEPPQAVVQPSTDSQVVRLTEARRLMAATFTESKSTIPHAWQAQEVDMSGVIANLGANNSSFQNHEGFALTYLPYVLAAIANSLHEHPEVNATFGKTSMTIHHDVHLAVSLEVDQRVFTGVVRHADQLSVGGLARNVHNLKMLAKGNLLKADEHRGGTFSVSDSDGLGTLFSYSIISPGESGLVTLGAVVDRPVALQGSIGIRPMMFLGFSLDHRVMDGIQAARFVTHCRRWLEQVSADTAIR
jgi:2-oxoisovalerate dehydrogenase E2 component (dihydrolipoyl transacylase)